MKRSVYSGVVCVLMAMSILGMTVNAQAQVVAKVNGEEILQQDIDTIVDMFVLPQFKAQNPDGELPEEQKQQIVKKIIDDLVTQRLILQAAKAANIQIDDATLQKTLENAKQQQPDASEEVLKDLVSKDLLTRTMISQVQEEAASKISISDEDAQKVFDEQKQQVQTQMETQIAELQQKIESSTDDEEKKTLQTQLEAVSSQNPFQKPEQISASHILIQVKPDASQEDKDAALEKITGVLEKANAGEDFAELAKEYSEGPSKDQGGDLGSFPRGAMVKPFEEAAFALEEGQISNVVETQFGYHIIKVTGKQAAGEVQLDDVKDQIKEQLSQQKQQAEVMEWLQQLRADATIEITE